jgi:hypothetical protein
VFSFILGLGLIIIARPVCKGSKCIKEKAPKPAEWNGQIYQFGASCHKYSTVIVDCPQEGYIESFAGLSENKIHETPVLQDRSRISTIYDAKV